MARFAQDTSWRPEAPAPGPGTVRSAWAQEQASTGLANMPVGFLLSVVFNCHTSCAGGIMKTVYLDQLHWSEISKAIHGLTIRDGTAETLVHMRPRVSEGKLLFPLSFAH